MSRRPLRIPTETLAAQSKAADPASSVWVSANAGSGKTHVLAQRVIRLLLRRTDPSKILCLTYTKAAAANMSNRVFRTLSAWTTLPDDRLAEEILAIEGVQPNSRMLSEARKLFARALETPGGLKIQTIHAFCESILHQFPLEANIAAHFELLDPKMEEMLVENVRREMLTGASQGDPQLAEAFATVLELGGEYGLDRLMREIVTKRDDLRRLIDRLGPHETRAVELFEAFGFRDGDSAAGIAGSIWTLPGFDPAYYSAFEREAHRCDARIVINSILPHASAAFAERDPIARLEHLHAGFLKSDGGPYDGAKSFKKALIQSLPDLPDRYLEAATAIIDASDRLALFRMVEATGAALDLADWMIGRYERAKSARGMLDFNDLIVRTVRLLARPDSGPWVQYKLDKGIDHILLDEAQDTSPDQWAVVKAMAGEFFAGEGQRGGQRTVFAVGDEKQSIYSFQGARPESFAETKHHFSALVRGIEGRFEDVRLHYSFRSTDDVLKAVDAVFGQSDARRGITHDDEPIEHKPIRDAAPGYVELWPSIGMTAQDEPEDWTEAIDVTRAPVVQLAERIAETIRRWIDDGEVIEGSGKRLTAGDVLVLVRKRGGFMNALSRSLKNRNIPVAGADRLSLPAHIAVKDLVALGRALLQPEDDLSLAAVLRSPIFGLSEEKLYELAHDRGKRSLSAVLRERAIADVELKLVQERLERWADAAAFKPVFEFYSRVLAQDGIRRKILARLGHEAGEVLDEFLNFALAEERAGLPGLESFLATIEGSALEVKREMDQTRDEVRLMTVHAAKGLEAPVVFLVDGGSAPISNQHMPVLVPVALEGEFDGLKGFLWNSGRDVANTRLRNLHAGLLAAADDEYRRLLYVGMTRAEDRLIVCGYHGKRAQSPTTWHSIVRRALEAASHTVPIEDAISEAEPALRYRVSPAPVTPPLQQETPSIAPEKVCLPQGLFEPLDTPDNLPRPLSPSGALALIEPEPEDAPATLKSPVLEAGDETSLAIARGLLVHKLMQVLPTLPDAERPAAAQRYVDRAAADWTMQDRESALAAVSAILDAPDFRHFFAGGSRAEVAIMGTLPIKGKDRIVSGTIDRLAVSEGHVSILDYKTNRVPPVTSLEVPEAYILQMALYRALLQPLYPDRTISASLLFTEAPRLITIPAEALDRALARLSAA